MNATSDCKAAYAFYRLQYGSIIPGHASMLPAGTSRSSKRFLLSSAARSDIAMGGALVQNHLTSPHGGFTFKPIQY